jgi:hypothetical protein
VADVQVITGMVTITFMDVSRCTRYCRKFLDAGRVSARWLAGRSWLVGGCRLVLRNAKIRVETLCFEWCVVSARGVKHKVSKERLPLWVM